MIAYRVLPEIMEDYALAGPGFVEVGLASVKEVGMPDEDVALAGFKYFF